MRYAVELVDDDEGKVCITFPDIPGLTTFGPNRADALWEARKAIESAISAAMCANEDIPWPESDGDAVVTLPLISVAKIELYLAMRAEAISAVELARRLKTNSRRVKLLLNLYNESRMSDIENAFIAVDRSLSIVVTRVRTARRHIISRRGGPQGHLNGSSITA